jgi:hypothetical protein
VHSKSPYYILELPPDASVADIERQGKKLLGLLEVGAAKAKTYTCPLGTFSRDDTTVREATAFLRDPARRAKEACLMRLLAIDDGQMEVAVEQDAPLPDAFALGGYRGL